MSAPALSFSPRTTRYKNPVFPGEFPDPHVVLTPEGLFAYATYTPGVKHLSSPNIQAVHTRDLQTWKWIEEGALAARPMWASTAVNLWAPHAEHEEGQYRIYYAADPDSRTGMCLAVGTSSQPFGFQDSGTFLCQGLASEGKSFAAIDPCPLYFEGRRWLYWGSHHQPIQVQELTADGTRFLEGSQPKAVIPCNPCRRYSALLEGVSVYARHGRFLALASGSNTWKKGEYAVTLFSADNPLGPFEYHGVILKGNKKFWSPGQGMMFTDKADQDWLSCHAVYAKDGYLPGTSGKFAPNQRGQFKRQICFAKVVYDRNGLIRPIKLTDTEQEGPVI